MPKERDISVADVKKIRDAEIKEKSQRVARDVFMLSYYLGGINLMDLMQYNFKDAKIMEYVRERWMGRNGKLDFGYKYSYPNFRNYVTKEIIRLGERLEVESHVVYYSARKSFVQHGFELGIPLETLEYCIGQSMKSNRPIFNYVRIMRKHADEAIRKILDNLK